MYTSLQNSFFSPVLRTVALCDPETSVVRPPIPRIWSWLVRIPLVHDSPPHFLAISTNMLSLLSDDFFNQSPTQNIGRFLLLYFLLVFIFLRIKNLEEGTLWLKDGSRHNFINSKVDKIQTTEYRKVDWRERCNIKRWLNWNWKWYLIKHFNMFSNHPWLHVSLVTFISHHWGRWLGYRRKWRTSCGSPGEERGFSAILSPTG